MATPRDNAWSALLLMVAAVGLGRGLQFANGAMHPDALDMVTLALGCCLVANLWWQPRAFDPAGTAPVVLLVGGGLAFQFFIHFTTLPGVYLRVSNEAMVEHHGYVAAAAIASGALLGLERGWGRTVAVLVMLGSFFLVGLWLLRASPNPAIDVVAWHRVSYEALAAGKNPYGIFMPNIYGHTMWYAAGLADAQQVKIGYPYPPVTFFLGGLGHWLKGDYRYANLAALTVAGAALSFARPGRLGPLAAAVLLFTPRSLFVLEQGWTEALSVMVFAVTLLIACRWPKWLPWAFGVLFATKQYFVLLAPLVPLLLGPGWSRRQLFDFFLRAGALAAGLTLPMALLDFGAFYRSVVAFQGQQPFRVEALSYVAKTAVNGQPTMPLWLSFPAIIPALALGLWRGARTPSGFAGASAFVFLLFFAFAKQAFCNYYFMIIAALCCAVGLLQPSTLEEDV